MAKPEDLLCKLVKSRLDFWKSDGIVIHTDDIRRLNLRQIRGMWVSSKPKGTPDLISYFKHKGICGILLIELKTKNDTHKQEQIAYMMKFKDLSNVHYLICRKPEDVSNKLEEITSHQQSKLEGMFND